ncbi:MAG: RagB/SusD family nutrient uptake outer membrane protein [Bacteroidia bacterium]|nr:RagB/SusD family nutrient uptake outer membrane protein [Bacteroidia bacterium]
MKKSIIAISMILGLFLTSTSCQDSLNIPQKNVYDTEEYYKNATADDAEKLIASIYRSIFRYQDVGVAMWLNIISDDNHAGNPFGANEFHIADTFTMTPTIASSIGTVYTNSYQIIYYSSMILEKIPETNDARINRVKAEAKFARAYAMSELIRWFGNPPLVKGLVTSDEDRYMANEDPTQVPPKAHVDWILENYDEAIAVLPALSGKGTQEAYGARISKHAAMAYAGKVCLWYATRFKDNSYLEKADKYLEQVVNSGLYGLVDDMSILETPKADFCEEYLFEHSAGDNDNYPGGTQNDLRETYFSWDNTTIVMPDYMYGKGWFWNHPTKDFAMFLENFEGSTETKRYRSTIMNFKQIADLTGTPYDKVLMKSIPHNEGWMRIRGNANADDFYNVTGFWKYTMTNRVYMRYAEVLLMYAEARFLKDGDANGKGLDALNQVRLRDGIAPISALTLQAIKDERRAELYTSPERYFDLLRWGDAPTVLKDEGKKLYTLMAITAEGEPVVTAIDGPGQGWQDKYWFFPYPQAQIEANPNLKQNPGW